MRTIHHLKLVLSYVPVALLLLLSAPLPGHAADAIPDPNTSLVAAADTVVPSDVENVKATAGDGSVTLSWNVATDNVGVKGYKLYYGTKSVTKDGGSYEKGPVDMGNKISYTLNGLTNGQPYYFAATAYDAAGNESENYSLEASGTPAHAAADNTAPKVAKAEAVTSTQVRVTFSKAVQIPSTNPESAFTVKNDGSSALLAVSSAVMDPDDSSNKSVLLTTAKQQAGVPYILTAGIALKDVTGNPVVSGTSDTAPFTGTDVVTASTPTQEQTSGPSLKSVTAMDSTHVDVAFSEPVVLKADGRENFIITEEQNIENTLDIQKVELSSTKTHVTLTTAPQKAIKYNLIAVDVANNSGATISVDKNATTFQGMAPQAGETPTTTQETQEVQPAPSGADTSPPTDAKNFVAEMIKDLIVTLTWTASTNTDNDLASYVLYTSTDGKDYGEGTVIDPNNLTFDVTNILPKVKYFFKLTARDTSGNESKGIVTSFRLTETGPGLVLLGLGALGAGKLFSGKKRNKRK